VIGWAIFTYSRPARPVFKQYQQYCCLSGQSCSVLFWNVAAYATNRTTKERNR